MIKVLLIENDFSEKILIQSRIPDYCTVVTVPDIASAEELLKNTEIDIVVYGCSVTAAADADHGLRLRKCSDFDIIVLTRDAEECCASDSGGPVRESFFRIPEQLNMLPDVFRAYAGKKLKTITQKQAYNIDHKMAGLVGSSEAILKVKERIIKFSSAPGPVLITGESGTGKEIAARLLHDFSDKADGPYLAVNAGAIPAGLSASEFFGSVSGAYTGAENRSGFFECADGGTLFLDEITEVDIPIQVELLRVLETGCIRRIGSNSSRRIDVRLISATNRNLKNEVRAGRFRRDLQYRIDMFRIHIPPLRERKEDIPDLLMHFSLQLEQERPNKVYRFSDSFIEKLFEYDWPGNVRELRNVFRRAVYLSDTEVLMPESVVFN